MGIGIPISQSKRPLPILFSSWLAHINVRWELRFHRGDACVPARACEIAPADACGGPGRGRSRRPLTPRGLPLKRAHCACVCNRNQAERGRARCCADCVLACRCSVPARSARKSRCGRWVSERARRPLLGAGRSDFRHTCAGVELDTVHNLAAVIINDVGLPRVIGEWVDEWQIFCGVVGENRSSEPG